MFVRHAAVTKDRGLVCQDTCHSNGLVCRYTQTQGCNLHADSVHSLLHVIYVTYYVKMLRIWLHMQKIILQFDIKTSVRERHV